MQSNILKVNPLKTIVAKLFKKRKPSYINPVKKPALADFVYKKVKSLQNKNQRCHWAVSFQEIPTCYNLAVALEILFLYFKSRLASQQKTNNISKCRENFF